MVQLIENALQHAAQVIRPVQVDHHLEPDAMRGSEEFLTGRFAPRDGEGNLVPMVNAEAARIDTLRSRMLSPDPLQPQAPHQGSVLGAAIPDDALTNADGSDKRVPSIPQVQTDAVGKPLAVPGSADPSWMAQAKAAGWEPTEPVWMTEARRAGWNASGARSDVAQPQPGATGRVQDFSRLSASEPATTGVLEPVPTSDPSSEPPLSAQGINAEPPGGKPGNPPSGTAPARTPA